MGKGEKKKKTELRGTSGGGKCQTGGKRYSLREKNCLSPTSELEWNTLKMAIIIERGHAGGTKILLLGGGKISREKKKRVGD